MAAENTGLDMVSTLTSHRGSREERQFHCYFYCLFCSVLGITEEPKRVFCHSHHLIIALVCFGLIYVSSDSSHTLFSCKRVLLKQDANEFQFFFWVFLIQFFTARTECKLNLQAKETMKETLKYKVYKEASSL